MICNKAGLDCFVIFGKKVVRSLVIEFYRCTNQKIVVVVNVISMVVELNTTDLQLQMERVGLGD